MKNTLISLLSNELLRSLLRSIPSGRFFSNHSSPQRADGVFWFKNKVLLALIFLTFLSCLIIAIWFKDGKLYGGGDIGLPTYNPILMASVAKYTWWDAQGTGFSYPAAVSALPFYLLFSIPQLLGASPEVIQMILFFLVIFLSLLGSFLLIIFISGNVVLSLIAAIFYLTNPYTLMNIFHRFNHTGMVMLFYIPWTLIFLYLGLNKRKIWFALILAISSLFGAYAFGTPAFLATWWFLIISFWLFVSLTGGKKNLAYNLLFLLTFILLWIGLNLWWLAPFLQTANVALAATTTSSGNIDSLRGVSRFFSLPFAFRGINSFFLTEQKDWGTIYTNPFFNLLSWIGFGLILTSLFSKNRHRFFNYFLILFLITVFISKGSEVPLGSFILAAFSAFPVLGVFRNSFEKFGVLLPLASSFLFACGVQYLWLKLSSRYNKKISFTIITTLLLGFVVVYPWPLWTGNIFGNLKDPARVVVPKEYEDMQRWFGDRKIVSPVILHLPLALGDSVVYDWGYNGLEISQLFFPGSSISHYLGPRFLDLRYQEIAQAVKNRNGLFLEYLLHNFGINYIVLHEDFNSNAYPYDSLDAIKRFIGSLSYVQLQNKLGRLDIYSVKIEQPSYGKIFFTANPTIITGNLNYFDNQVIEDDFNSNIFITNPDQLKNFQNNENIILPDQIINYPSASISKENALNELPYARYLPGSFLYNLVRIKEVVELFAKNDEEKFKAELDYTNKRLVESYGLLKNKDHKRAGTILEEYLLEIKNLLPITEVRIKTANFNNDIDALQAYQGLFLRQRTVLKENILSLSSNYVKNIVLDAIDFIDKEIADVGLQPIYSNIFPFPNPIIRFHVPGSGEYFLRLKKSAWGDLLSSDLKTTILVDGKIGSFDIKSADDSEFLEVGPFDLQDGEHEFVVKLSNQERIDKNKVNVVISNNNLISNLSNDLTGFKIQVRSDETTVDYLLNNVDVDSFYEISFQYWVKYGEPPILSVIEDIDSTKDGEIVPSFKKEVAANNYDFFWHPLTINFKPNKMATKMKVRISLRPWNNCLSIYQKDEAKCLNKNIFNQHSRDSEVEIKSLSIRKIPTFGAVLVKNNYSLEISDTKLVNNERIDPTQYKVNLNTSSSGVLIFNNSYHDYWSLEDLKNNKFIREHVLVNGYANGWILPNSETIDLKMKFDPQTKEEKSLRIGLVIFAVGMMLILVIRKVYERI